MYQDNSKCARLVNVFSDIFISKLQRLQDATAAVLQSSMSLQFHDHDYDKKALAHFCVVTTGDVTKVLLTMPATSSSLDVLLTSLVKQCADVFSPVSTAS